MSHPFPRPLPVALLIGAVGLGVALWPAPDLSPHPAERTIAIRASSFEFSPPVISVNPGDRVTVELTAADVVHGLYLDGYGLNLIADPGQTSRLTFTADRPGAFRFRCSVTCGPLHPFMIGKFNVGPNWLLWRAVALAVLGVAGAIVGYEWRRKRSENAAHGPISPRRHGVTESNH